MQEDAHRTTRSLPHVDVLVIGAGLAGITAAISASADAATVAIASLGGTCSGSSFSPSTWGLGLVSPEGPNDVDDMCETILEIGCSVADEPLVRSFVEGIEPAVAALETLGATFMTPEDPTQQGFVPCFDHKRRTWRGIEGKVFSAFAKGQLEARGVRELCGHELVDLIELPDGRIAGAILFDHASGALVEAPASAVILACGGTGALFATHLGGHACTATAQAIALRHGATLTNVEFIQIMPMLVSPRPGAVFNEKAFRYARPAGRAAAPGSPVPQDVSEPFSLRAGHGPYTSRLASRAVDEMVFAARDGILSLRLDPPEGLSEIDRTYFRWLAGDGEGQVPDEVRIRLAAHASNGGIAIDATCRCGVEGLFAAGEATGGMHGADRLGGVSSAGAIVFGMRAGAEAVAYARSHGEKTRGARAPWNGGKDLLAAPVAASILPEVAEMLERACMVSRTAEGLTAALRAFEGLSARLEGTLEPARTELAFAETMRARHQLLCARSLAAAMLAREESRGSHHRADHPRQDDAFSLPSTVRLDGSGSPRVGFGARGQARPCT